MRPSPTQDSYAERRPDGVVDWLGEVIDRAPLTSIAVIALLVAFAGMSAPALLDPRPSCSDHVEAVAKSVARVRGAPELSQRLVAASLICESGDQGQAKGLLAQLREDARLLGY